MEALKYSNSKDFAANLSASVKEVETIIKSYLPKVEGYQETVMDAMNYSFMAGGKRLRPMIMQKSYKAFGGVGRIIEPFMAALEMIHTYSLVHDDLPEMDNDELRRGKPTTHIKYGQAMAVLAGDGLLNYAFETALKAVDMEPSAEESVRILKAMKVLSGKAGIYGMIGGQVVDVESEKNNEQLSMEQLIFIHENKTAALLQCALMVGALLAGASDEDVAILEEAGRHIGVAFQIQDDILDVTSTTEVLGKPVGSDEENGKLTYVSYNGLEKSIEDQKAMSAEAVNILTGLKMSKCQNEHMEFLIELVESLVNRKL